MIDKSKRTRKKDYYSLSLKAIHFAIFGDWQVKKSQRKGEEKGL